MRAGLLALLEHRDRHLAEPLRQLRLLFDQLAQPNRTGKAGRAGTDDENADLDPLVLRIGRLGDVIARRERRRKVTRAAHPLRWRTSSVSLGTISCTSPTTPRSLNSKIGAFASLLIATIVLELCMPTLCWMAPEMPRATYSFGETVLPVWPICALYGYQPASTTARVAPTAPPSAFASSSASVKFSGAPRPRPPATTMSASSIEGPVDSSSSCPTTFACCEYGCRSTVISSICGSPPEVAAASKLPARKSARRGVASQPTSTRTESCSAGRWPTKSAVRSTRSQFRPASSRAASPLAMSAARTEFAKRTVS